MPEVEELLIVLHGAVVDEGLSVWGEVGHLGKRTPSRRALPRTGADRAALSDALRLILPPGASWQEGSAIAWLPSQGGRPLLSSPILGTLAEAADAELTPFEVACLNLSPSSALALLRRCSDDGRPLAPGLFPAQDLHFLAEVAQLALSLVARHAVLPAIRKTPEGSRGIWRPHLGPRDTSALGGLQLAMPPACRALGKSAEDPPSASARDLTQGLLSSFVDCLMRPEDVPSARHSANPHDLWVESLVQPQTRNVPAAAMSAIADDIDAWSGPLRRSESAHSRLCLRLEDPLENGDPWRVHYLLQALDDPSLILPAEDVWSERTGPTAYLTPQDLLSELGAAARLSPEIAASLAEARPTGYDLDTTGAYLFLNETVWALEQAGMGLQLPAFWNGENSRHLTARATAKAVSAGGGRLGLDSVVDFDWQVALGDETLSLQELEELAQAKVPLVRLRGQWVEVSADQVRAGLALLRGEAEGRSSLRDAVRMAIGGEDPGRGLEISEVRGQGEVGGLLSRLLKGTAPDAAGDLEAPPGLRAVLRPYQRRGYTWLNFLGELGVGACLADDMGLGKTLQTLAMIQRDRDQGGTGPYLLVCPTSVLSQWRSEAGRFTPDLPVHLHHGQQRLRQEEFLEAADSHALVLTSYSLLHRDVDLLQTVRWRGVVLDEAQNIKNPSTQGARAARALRADRRIALTGTPVENNVLDLWSIMEFLNLGLLGTRQGFMRRFFVPIQSEGSAQARQRLRRATGPFLLRRLKSDPAVAPDLPDKIETKVHCPLTREQATLYQAVLRDFEASLQEAEGMSRRGMILAALTKLKQVCNHPAQFLADGSALPGRSGKLARLAEMLEEVTAEGDRALVFTQFREMGALLQRYLQESLGKEVLFLHGQVPREQRERLVARFQAEGDGPAVFILSLKAGGTGLNLTRARHVFHFDRWWNPAVEDQATDRAYRIGQARQVQVHKFVCLGTVEERIDALMESKRELAGSLVGTGEAWLTELGTDELRSLFRLDPDALED